MRRSDIDAIPAEGDVAFRQRAVEPDKTALLVVDLQKGEYNEDKCAAEPHDASLWERIANSVIPNGRRLLAACRATGVEVMFTVVECLTLDGRDRSLDYKISKIDVPKGSSGARMPDEIAPLDDEIVIPKTASSVFNATNIDYVLRNLEIDYLMIAGMLTDQCVESAVRDACDAGFLVTLVEDACATYSQERHDATLRAIKGYCRIVRTDALVAELAAG